MYVRVDTGGQNSLWISKFSRRYNFKLKFKKIVKDRRDSQKE